MKSGFLRFLKLWPGMLMLVFICGTACNSNDPAQQVSNKKSKNDNNGYTGVYKSYRDGYLYSEVSLINGQRNGISVMYYPGGGINSQVMYKDGIKVDTSKWFYTNGNIYRKTPYKNGKIHGTQLKFHKDGSILAEIPYENGKRKFGLREFSRHGNEIKSYPSIVIRKEDLRPSTNCLIVHLSLSNNAKKTKFYLGYAQDEIFDSSKLKYLLTENGKSQIRYVEKPGYKGETVIYITAEYITRLGNKKYISGKTSLPSDNLKN